MARLGSIKYQVSQILQKINGIGTSKKETREQSGVKSLESGHKISDKVHSFKSMENLKNDLTNLATYAKTEFKIGTKVILHFILDKGKTNRAIEIHLRDNQKDITIGNDSKQLLIGIFLSKKTQLNYDIINKIQSRLNLFFADEIGLQGLEPLSDPLPPTIQPEPQLTLNL